MSLIQEALRRQQEDLEAEKRGEKPKEPTPPPPQEETDEDTPQTTEADAETPLSEDRPKMTLASRKKQVEAEATEEEPEAEDENPVRRSSPKEQKVVGSLFGAIIILVILLGFVGWAALYGYRMLTAEKPDTEGEPAEVAEAQPRPVDTISTADPASGEPEDLESNGAIASEPEPVAVVQDTIATTPEDEGSTTASEDAVMETGASVEDATPEPPAVTATTKPEDPQNTAAKPADPAVEVATPISAPADPIIWPQVHVAGVIGAGENGSAIINGEVIGKNEMVNEITVREFGKGFVLLEYQGETRKFSVGRPVR